MKNLTQGILACDTIKEIQDAVDACHAWMIAHVPGYTAKLWDEPKQSGKDGKISIYVDHRVFDALTPTLLQKIAAIKPADTLAFLKP